MEGLVVVAPENPARPNFLDLGSAPHGAVLERTVHLANRDERPLTIRDVVPSCGCTHVTASWTADDGRRATRKLGTRSEPLEIAAGAEFELAFTTDTTLVPAWNTPKLVSVRVRNDSSNAPYLTFELALVVEKAFAVLPATVELGAIPENGDVQRVVQVVASDSSGRVLTGTAEAPPRFNLDLEPVGGTPRPTWNLVIHVEPPHDRGTVNETIVLTTSGPSGEGDGQPLSIPVKGRVVDDIHASPSRLQFPPFASARGATARVELSVLLSGLRVAIADAHAIGERAEALTLATEALDAREDGLATRFAITLEAPPGLPLGPFSGTVIVALDSSPIPKVRIPYGGEVRAD